MIAKWIIIGFELLGAIAYTLIIGKERKPITPGESIMRWIVVLIVVGLMLRYWQ